MMSLTMSMQKYLLLLFHLYFSEKRRPNTLYQELSYQEGENVPEGDDANDIAGMTINIEFSLNCLCINNTTLMSIFSVDYLNRLAALFFNFLFVHVAFQCSKKF